MGPLFKVSSERLEKPRFEPMTLSLISAFVFATYSTIPLFSESKISSLYPSSGLVTDLVGNPKEAVHICKACL